VTAEHYDHRAFLSACLGDRGDHELEVARDENVGKRFQECREAAVLQRWRGEFRSGDLVGAPLNWNGANSGEIGFRCLRGTSIRGFGSRALLRKGAAITAYGLGDGK
jgi:hypothetical protein